MADHFESVRAAGPTEHHLELHQDGLGAARKRSEDDAAPSGGEVCESCGIARVRIGLFDLEATQGQSSGGDIGDRGGPGDSKSVAARASLHVGGLLEGDMGWVGRGVLRERQLMVWN